MIRLLLALALGASAQTTRISLTGAARQPTLTTDDVEQLLAVAQRPVTPPGLVIVERTELEAVWKSNFGSTAHAIDPTSSPNCICSMAWKFYAIDATSSPWPRRLDGVEAHWLIPHRSWYRG